MWKESLKRMKVESGLTTAEIAKGAEIPEPTLEKLFAGVTKDPKLPTMQKLVHFLGYTLDDLYPEEKKSPAPSEDSAGEKFKKIDDTGQNVEISEEELEQENIHIEVEHSDDELHNPDEVEEEAEVVDE